MMLGTLFETFLRWNNNASHRPKCVIIQAQERYEPMGLGLVLYNVTGEKLVDVFPYRIQHYSAAG